MLRVAGKLGGGVRGMRRWSRREGLLAVFENERFWMRQSNHSFSYEDCAHVVFRIERRVWVSFVDGAGGVCQRKFKERRFFPSVWRLRKHAQRRTRCHREGAKRNGRNTFDFDATTATTPDGNATREGWRSVSTACDPEADGKSRCEKRTGSTEENTSFAHDERQQRSERK